MDPTGNHPSRTVAPHESDERMPAKKTSSTKKATHTSKSSSAKGGATLASARPTGATNGPTDARWWKLIERAGLGGGDEQVEKLVAALQATSIEEIVAFDRFLSERIRDAYRSDLWAVAYLMNGGCSDDGFDYFIGWLIGKGQKHYEAALASPPAAARGVDPDDEPFENETIWYVASKAYLAKTGKEDYEQTLAPSIPRTLIGEPFDEETVGDLYPKLAEKFGG